MVYAVPAPAARAENRGVRRLLLVLAVSAALASAGTGTAAAAVPAVRLTIVHVVHGCHSWGTAASEALAPTRSISVRRHTRVQVRVSCAMDFVFRQTLGPRVPLGDPLTHSGTTRTLVFRATGVYRFTATSAQSSTELGLQTLGPDAVLVLLVRVR